MPQLLFIKNKAYKLSIKYVCVDNNLNLKNIKL